MDIPLEFHGQPFSVDVDSFSWLSPAPARRNSAKVKDRGGSVNSQLTVCRQLTGTVSQPGSGYGVARVGTGRRVDDVQQPGMPEGYTTELPSYLELFTVLDRFYTFWPELHLSTNGQTTVVPT